MMDENKRAFVSDVAKKVQDVAQIDLKAYEIAQAEKLLEAVLSSNVIDDSISMGMDSHTFLQVIQSLDSIYKIGEENTNLLMGLEDCEPGETKFVIFEHVAVDKGTIVNGMAAFHKRKPQLLDFMYAVSSTSLSQGYPSGFEQRCIIKKYFQAEAIKQFKTKFSTC